LAVIAAIAVVQGFGRIQHFNESYQVAREFTLLLQKNNPRAEAKRLFNSRCKSSIAECEEDRILVWLEDIPEVGWEYERYLSKNNPYGTFDVGGHELGIASNSLLLLFAPLALLLVIYLQIRTLRKIATILSGNTADYGEIQQRLNSVFNERATKKLGEHRRVYATVWILVILA